MTEQLRRQTCRLRRVAHILQHSERRAPSSFVVCGSVPAIRTDGRPVRALSYMFNLRSSSSASFGAAASTGIASVTGASGRRVSLLARGSHAGSLLLQVTLLKELQGKFRSGVADTFLRASTALSSRSHLFTAATEIRLMLVDQINIYAGHPTATCEVRRRRPVLTPQPNQASKPVDDF